MESEIADQGPFFTIGLVFALQRIAARPVILSAANNLSYDGETLHGVYLERNRKAQSLPLARTGGDNRKTQREAWEAMSVWPST